MGVDDRLSIKQLRYSGWVSVQKKRGNELMLQQDGRVVFSRSTLSNAGKMVPVLRKATHLCIRGIVSSDFSALTSRVNGITPIEHENRNCAGLVTV